MTSLGIVVDLRSLLTHHMIIPLKERYLYFLNELKLCMFLFHLEFYQQFFSDVEG